ncbi:MAG: peptidylprolyl isomerase [Opitutae bacterium]|nr:peptidylprolyl isomerase [Opitutae bacterium]
MKIKEKSVAAFRYTLKDESGKILDSSNDRDGPLEYLHGAGNIIPGLERELLGMEVGEKKSVKVEPADGYGFRRSELVISVPRTNIEFDGDIVPGMRFHAEDGDGGVHAFVVVDVANGNVKMDGNHPLAGVTLFFDVEITDVREATAREIAEGHPHMEGCSCGCHHHHHDGGGECKCGGKCDCDNDGGDDDCCGGGCNCGCEHDR